MPGETGGGRPYAKRSARGAVVKIGGALDLYRPSIFQAKFQNLLLFSTAGMKTSPQKHMRVLIADDQKSVGTSLAEMVSLCHHQVV